MFLAYEVVATAPYGARSKPLLLDLESVYNVNTLLKQGRTAGEDEACFVRGRLLGFVEITKRPYGIGTQNEESKEIFMDADGTRRDEDGNELSEFDQRGPLRPVLTNLAVRKDSRKYGIGSKLLDACEQHVQQCWQMNEIILEVEDYNIQALEFYRKRGYDVLFSDPASRRYDVQGLWLRKVRCRRDVMRKVFHGGRMNKVENSAMDLFDRIRQGWR
jgi:ribosomal protein S18 acetylase RimI-like enzyme